MITAKLLKRHTAKCDLGYKEQTVSVTRPAVSWCMTPEPVRARMAAAAQRVVRLRQGDRITYMTAKEAQDLAQQLQHFSDLIEEYNEKEMTK